MKKNKDVSFEHTSISWEEFAQEMSAGRKERGEKEMLEWDRPLVDETWSIDDPVTGELPPVAVQEKETLKKGLTAMLPSEDAIYNATLNEDLDLSEAILRKLENVADAKPVDEQAIRSSVDRKIVIKSEELKGRRAQLDAEPKRKVRRRIPKNPDEMKEKGSRRRLSADEKRDLKYKHTELHEDPKMSAFREKSMNWKDGGGSVSSGMGEEEDLPGVFSRIRNHFGRYTALEWVSVILAVIIVGTAAMTSAVYADYQSEQNRAQAIASLKKYENSANERVAETVVEEEEPAAVGAQDAIVEVKSLSLVLSSVEKDL
ncbi:MAG: hypothetical protein J6Y57_07545, partial [Lachnospiraceae bacterium]|nr:hypothetical protein [Lachnospiraceae bacterium]